MEYTTAFQKNRKHIQGQILIEALFLSVVVAGLLMVFSKLITHHRQHMKKHHFSQPWKESGHDKGSVLFLTQ